MSDEKIETGKGADSDKPASAGQGTPPTDDRNTDVFEPEVTGGQPAVGDDRPRNTEY